MSWFRIEDVVRVLLASSVFGFLFWNALAFEIELDRARFDSGFGRTHMPGCTNVYAHEGFTSVCTDQDLGFQVHGPSPFSC